MVKEILLDPAITYSSDMPKGRKLVPVNGDMFHCQGTARTPSCRTGSASGRKKAHGCSCQRTEPSTRVRDAANVRRLFRCHRVRANKEAPGEVSSWLGAVLPRWFLCNGSQNALSQWSLQHELPCSANALQLNAPSATWLRGMTSTGDFLEDSPYKPSNSNMIHKYIHIIRNLNVGTPGKARELSINLNLRFSWTAICGHFGSILFPLKRSDESRLEGSGDVQWFSSLTR